MKKLKLNLDELKIESFETSVQKPNNKGTIHGNITGNTCDEPTCAGTCPENPCPTNNTCETDCGQNTCGGMTCVDTACVHTCDFSCDFPVTQCQ